MNILWHSNAPWVGSGYGTQTDLFAGLLAKAGHEVTVSAYYGLRGAKFNANGVRILPGGNEGWGNDILTAHVEALKPDVTVALMDLWVLHDSVIKESGVTAWAPVDHDPVPPTVADKLKLVKHAWAMSRFAEQQMRNLGLDPAYVPHGVDTDVFVPADRSAARAQLALDDSTFLVVCVAANKGWPSRKSLDRLLKAWGRFVQSKPDSVLYIHADPRDAGGGVDLATVARYYGVPERTLRFPDLYRLVRGDYGSGALNTLYNAADVMVLPSAGGGFEIPLIEAQAAGCPVVTTAVTAMAELVGPGYGIPVDPFDGMAWTLQESEQANVLPSQILTGLEWAYDQRGNAKLRADSREFALEYDGRRVLAAYMLPALEKAAARPADEALRDARSAQRRALRDRPAEAPEPRFAQHEAI